MDGLTANGPKVLHHLAIIMDGNGRWAAARGLPRVAGHRQGVEAVRRVVRAAVEFEIPYLTLFGFSSENWKRPAQEVAELMGLLRRYLRSEISDLHKAGVKIKVIGERARLAPDLARLIEDAEARTAANAKLCLTVALSYGGRQEILAATRALAQAVADGALAAGDIDETRFVGALQTNDLPPPDLLIRTSGEQRISNFLLWQLAYAELFFTDRLWPDFDKNDLAIAIAEFQRRERRYGAVTTTG